MSTCCRIRAVPPVSTFLCYLAQGRVGGGTYQAENGRKTQVKPGKIWINQTTPPLQTRHNLERQWSDRRPVPPPAEAKEEGKRGWRLYCGGKRSNTSTIVDPTVKSRKSPVIIPSGHLDSLRAEVRPIEALPCVAVTRAANTITCSDKPLGLS